MRAWCALGVVVCAVAHVASASGAPSEAHESRLDLTRFSAEHHRNEARKHASAATREGASLSGARAKLKWWESVRDHAAQREASLQKQVDGAVEEEQDSREERSAVLAKMRRADATVEQLETTFERLDRELEAERRGVSTERAEQFDAAVASQEKATRAAVVGLTPSTGGTGATGATGAAGPADSGRWSQWVPGAPAPSHAPQAATGATGAVGTAAMADRLRDEARDDLSDAKGAKSAVKRRNRRIRRLASEGASIQRELRHLRSDTLPVLRGRRDVLLGRLNDAADRAEEARADLKQARKRVHHLDGKVQELEAKATKHAATHRDEEEGAQSATGVATQQDAAAEAMDRAGDGE